MGLNNPNLITADLGDELYEQFTIMRYEKGMSKSQAVRYAILRTMGMSDAAATVKALMPPSNKF